MTNAENENQDFTLSLEDSKRASRQIETYYGTFGIVMMKWSRRLEELKQLEPLAIMIATFSTLAASGCFLAANRLPRQ